MSFSIMPDPQHDPLRHVLTERVRLQRAVTVSQGQKGGDVQLRASERLSQLQRRGQGSQLRPRSKFVTRGLCPAGK
jgi:hypothetical protein